MNAQASIQRSTEVDLYELLSERTLPVLRAALEHSERGQRLRVTTLPEQVMGRLCGELQGDARWYARVLVVDRPVEPWQATATKLIELRNVLPQPLLVFVPPGLRTAAEDSLDIATFNELSLTRLASDLSGVLLDRLPAELREAVRDALDYLRVERVVRHPDQEIDYLLTVHKNGADRRAAGGALFAFGLVPDFKVFERGRHRFWLSRNVKARGELADIRRPLQERISRLPLQPNTVQRGLFTFLRQRHAEDVQAWATEVACDPAHQHLSFDEWKFHEGEGEQDLRIIVDKIDLPRQTEDRVQESVRMPVLDLEGKQGLKVTFRSLPQPAQVDAWTTFRIQILSGEGEQPSVAWESNNFPKPKSRASVNRTIKVADLQRLEEGTYYLKIDAYDRVGSVLTSPRPVDPDDPTGRDENESEEFLVIRGDTEVEAPVPRAASAPSLIDAWIAVAAKQLSSRQKGDLPTPDQITGIWQEPTGASVRGDVHFKLEGGSAAGYTVTVPGLLRKVELAILRNPDRLGVIRLNLDQARGTSEVEPELREVTPLPDDAKARAYLEARRAAFEAIRDQHRQRAEDEDEDREGIIEAADLLELAGPIDAYANAYAELCGSILEGDQANTVAPPAGSLATLARMDMVELRWRRTPGDPGRALVLAPTHPLRMLWHLQHANLCGEALGHYQTKERQVASWADFMRQLRTGIVPANLPPVLFDDRGRGHVEQGLLTPYWPLYLPDRSGTDFPADVSACRDMARRLLGIRKQPGQNAGGARSIATQLYDYLQQHPYAEQLRLNVFSPGDGQLIADSLRELERLRIRLRPRGGKAPPLRYAVQMFGAGASLEDMGEALEALLDPDRQVGEDDEFTLTSANHLLPKLIFARKSIEDFLTNPGAYPAHVSVFLDQLGVHCRLGNVATLRRGSYVGGLVQEPETVVEAVPPQFGWWRGLRPATGKSAGKRESLLSTLVQRAQQAQAAASLGERQAGMMFPVVALQLDSTTQALLRQVHDQSDWVVTVDRNMGVEYYDSASSGGGPVYLLDFSPEYLQEGQYRVLLTTRNTAELDIIVRPALEQFGLSAPEGAEVVVVETLRSLSGRLALRLLAAPTQSAEVIGLLLARWMLEQAGLLHDRVVIPLDAHRSWFQSEDPQEEATEVNRRRADLLLVAFDPAKRVVQLTIVEVKLREDLSDSARASLYREMSEQMNATRQKLRFLFDPDLYPTQRADAALRAKELTTLLAFYLRRGLRYGLIGAEEAEAALDFVQTLDDGYTLDIRSVGVLFLRQCVGTHADEDEPGFVVHRFGLDVADRLLKQACERHRARPGSDDSDPDGPSTPPEPPPPSLPPGDEIFGSLLSFLGGKTSLLTKPRTAPSLVREPLPPARKKPGLPTPELSVAAPPVESPAEPRPLTGASPGSELSVAAPLIESPTPVTPAAVEQVRSPISPSPHLSPSAEELPGLQADVLLGASERTPQFGLLGTGPGGKVAIDLTGCNTVSLFGVQGFGKSYTLGVMAEMAVRPAAGINVLPAPLATVIFHYHKSDAYAPEFATAVKPNAKVVEVERLLQEYGARPAALEDVMLLAPEARVADRQRDYPGIQVRPIKFTSADLGAESWKFLLGAYGNDSLYIRQMVAIMRRHRQGLTLDRFEEEIRQAELPAGSRRLAEDRIALARPYIDDSSSLAALLRPGRTIIVDLRDQWIEKDEALGLFVVMLRMFAASRFEGKEFNKLVIFDEAHKYITESELIGQVVETIREMRHQATSVLIASQDPLSVPRAVVELTSVLILHRMTSPQWLKHLKSAISALDGITEGHLAALKPGEAMVWAQRATDPRYSQRPQKVTVRPRFTQHGGGTKTAVEGETVR